MKKIFGVILQVFFLLLLTNQQVQAVIIGINPPTGVMGGTVNPTNVISFILNILVVLAVVASIAFIIHGGFKWSTSGGDKVAVESARNQIVAAVIGLVVVLVSFVIIGFVRTLLGSTGDIFNFTINNLVTP